MMQKGHHPLLLSANLTLIHLKTAGLETKIYVLITHFKVK